jgi:hypothetical protein
MAKSFQDYIVVVDLETLAVGSDAVILSLGLTVSKYNHSAVKTTFDSLKNNGLYLKFNIKEQLTRGRKTSKRVIGWWYEQESGAKKVLNPNPAVDVSLYDLPRLLKEYFDSINLDIKKVDLYDRNCFDISKLQYLFEEELGLDVPWNYNNTFDIPTALRFLGMDRYAGVRVSDFPGAMYHNALDDAAVDHMRMMKALHMIQEDDVPF